MTAITLDGQKVANQIATRLKQEVRQLAQIPILAVFLLGDDPESKVYLQNKINRATQIGVKVKVRHLPNSIRETRVIELIKQDNQDPQITGIMVQLPLPPQISYYHIVKVIDPLKDVDGFSELNVGKLWNGDSDFIVPATPRGILTLLAAYNIALSKKHVVIVGRSNLVGKPLAGLCLASNSTVTLTHKKTTNLPQITQTADILVVAIGQAQMIDQNYLKNQAVVVDVGTNATPQGLKGDVDFAAVKEKAAYLTPVPKGVGPMTVISLLENLVEVAQRNQRLN